MQGLPAQFHPNKKTLISVAGVFTTATLLLTSMEATSAPAPGVNSITLNPIQRQAVASTAAKHATLRRGKQARIHHTTAVAPLSATQLRRALRATNKQRGRQAGKLALIDATQQHALRTLNATTQDQDGVRAHFDAHNGTLAFLKPQGKAFAVNIRSLAQGTSVPSMVAQQFLADQHGLLKLDDPLTETRVIKQLNDTTGRSHVRLQQVYKGVPLWGKELLVHTQDTNGVYLMQGSYEPTPHHLDTAPAIGAEQALAAVRADLHTDATAQNELVIYTPEKGAPLLAYKIDIMPAPDSRWLYFINARNGKIAHRIKNIHANVVSASGADLDGVTRSFNAWSQSGQFYLIDPNTPTADASPNPLTNGPNSSGDMFILNAQNGDGTQLAYNSSNAQNSGWDATAVSAAYNTRVVYDYYKNTFGRDSLDGKGMNLMVATHFDNNHNNAFWNGTFMVYGDGDNQLFTALAGCLDVAAHEMTHGVIEHSANLIYQNQSGALNEAFADIFGAMVDDGDWLMGEDCTVATPGFLRNMKNPAQGLSPQPTKMSEYQNLPNTAQGDNGGVHINSGIPNRAAYLIAEGLSAEGLGTSIGRTKTAQIFYRALTVYLTASAQFVDARRATIQAATDLYGAAETQAVTAAWNAVEVTDNSGNAPAPTSTDAVQGGDLMVYLYPRDGVFTDPSEPFDLYVQVMNQPLTVYDPNNDYGPFNIIDVAYTRPAAYTDQDGPWILYVGVDNNLYVVDPNGQNSQITDTNDISSIAVSPDSRYFAYTTADTSDNTIHILDLVDPAKSADVSITPPSYQENGGGANTIFYADALSFDYSGRFIVFDALNCISTPGDPCDINAGTGYQYWSIGQLNVTNGQFLFPFPNQNPIIDLGFPSFAANNQSVIALDYQDWTNGASNIASSIVTLNLETQKLKTIYSFTDTTKPHFGTPSFWGDDTYLTFQIPDATNGRTAVRIGIDSNWGKSGTLESINPYAAAEPIMHRAGQRVLTGGLSANTVVLDFGSTTLGASKSLTFILSNTGNNDVNITGITLDGAAFQHNATNMRVPRSASLPVTITFASAVTGAQTGTLIFVSDGTPSTLSVSLVGTSVPTTPIPTPTPPNSGGGGGGGAFDPWSILFIASVPWLLRRNGKQKDDY